MLNLRKTPGQSRDLAGNLNTAECCRGTDDYDWWWGQFEKVARASRPLIHAQDARATSN